MRTEALARPYGPAREPLSYALGTRGRVSSLRTLSLITEPVTQREVARRSRLQHRTVQLALDELVQLGLVARLEGGRDFLVSLNREHRLAPALETLFRVEAEHFLELRAELLGVFGEGRMRKDLVSLVLFGSAARAEDLSSSDLDLLLIAKDAPSLERAGYAIGDAEEGLARRFGVMVRPIGYSLAQARRLWKQRRAPLAEVHRDGIPILGPPLRELLDGED